MSKVYFFEAKETEQRKSRIKHFKMSFSNKKLLNSLSIIQLSHQNVSQSTQNMQKSEKQ